MALITRYVNRASTPGGDGTTNATTGATRAYAGLGEWEANEQTDLVTATDQHIAHAVGTTADTTPVDVNGWTTSVTFYITIQVDAANRPTSAQYSTSNYRLESSGTATLLILSEIGTKVFGLQIYRSNITSDSFVITSLNATDCEMAYNFIRGNNNSSWFDTCIAAGAGHNGPNYVYNNILYDATIGIDFNSAGGAGDHQVYSNTVQGCVTGIRRLDGVFLAKNNIVQDCTTDWSGTFSSSSANNNSEDGTHPGTSGQTGTVSFVDKANDDFSLASGDTVAKGNGVDTSSDTAPMDFTDDIIGTARGATWDIGAHQVTVAAGGATGKSNPLMGPLGGPLAGPIG